MMVESRRLVAQYLTLHLSADRVNAGRAEYLQQQQAQPIADLRQGQGWRHLLTPVGLPDQKSHRDQGQGHVVMPALGAADKAASLVR
jgi:hypothetical protein